MRFFRKSHAINEFINNGNAENRLFQEDINDTGAKFFHVCTTKKIFDMINKGNDNFFNFGL